MRPSPKPTAIAARIASPTMKAILYRSKKDGGLAAGAAGTAVLAGAAGAAAVAEPAGIAAVAGVAGFDELATPSSLGPDIRFSLTRGADTIAALTEYLGTPSAVRSPGETASVQSPSLSGFKHVEVDTSRLYAAEHNLKFAVEGPRRVEPNGARSCALNRARFYGDVPRRGIGPASEASVLASHIRRPAPLLHRLTPHLEPRPSRVCRGWQP
jgi:hypothetical protein